MATVTVRAALLPHPPLLVPQLAGGAASELDPLRSACHKALDAVASASSSLVVIGDGALWGVAARAAVGSFAPYGADIEVQLPSSRLWIDIPTLPEPRRLEALPLSLAIAAWLLDTPAPGERRRLRVVRDTASRGDEPPASVGARGTARLSEVPPVAGTGEAPIRRIGSPIGEGAQAAGAEAPVASRRLPPLFACTVPATLGPGAAAAIGRALVEEVANRGPVGVVAMADLSARRTQAAPGALHPRAAAFDAGVARAFTDGDLTALAELDPAEAAELQVGGRAVLQALAGAVDGQGPLAGQVLYDEAPYGVGYLVGILEGRADLAPGQAVDHAR